MTLFRSAKLGQCAFTMSVLGALVSQLQAETTATQSFSVTVPQSINLTSPSNISLIHDESNNPQAFPVQTWNVRGNAAAGVHVTFATATPFIHAADATFKRDAQLELKIGATHGPADWTVGTGKSNTDYATGSEVAQVTASSNGVGKADLLLTISFLTGEFGQFASGNYITTITGTVAAN